MTVLRILESRQVSIVRSGTKEMHQLNELNEDIYWMYCNSASIDIGNVDQDNDREQLFLLTGSVWFVGPKESTSAVAWPDSRVLGWSPIASSANGPPPERVRKLCPQPSSIPGPGALA